MRKILGCTILLLISWSSAIWAGPEVPDFGKLVGPPSIREKDGNYYAVFDFGGLKFKYEVIKMPVRYSQCDALEMVSGQIKVVGSNPQGYIFFVKRVPFAFKTFHNPEWQDIIQKLNHG